MVLAFDVPRAIQYRQQGLKWSEIGLLVGVRGNALSQYFARHPELLHQAHRLSSRHPLRRVKRRCWHCSQVTRGISCRHCGKLLIVERD